MAPYSTDLAAAEPRGLAEMEPGCLIAVHMCVCERKESRHDKKVRSRNDCRYRTEMHNTTPRERKISLPAHKKQSCEKLEKRERPREHVSKVSLSRS